MLMETRRPAHAIHNRNDAWLYVDELTHRTANDYTAMLAVVEHASDFVADPMGQRALARVAERLRGAAIAHRALRDPKTDAPKRLDAELELLCEALCASLLEGRPISLTLNCDPIELNGQHCWRLCLILSELVRNAVRHAFVAHGAGRIIIEVRQEAGGLRCVVMDDGGANAAIVPGRGMKIVDGLAADLGGLVRRAHHRNGSMVVLTLPMESERAASREDALSSGARR